MSAFIEEIKRNLLMSFLNIPNTMAKLFDKNTLESLKTSEEKAGDQEEKTNLTEDEDILEQFISSSSGSEEDLVSKIKKKVDEKKVAIDLFNGRNAEYLLVNRIDRDVFELKYHKSYEYNQNFNFMKLNQNIPSSSKELEELNLFLKEANQVMQFLKSIGINLEGEIDFIIHNVKAKDIKDVLSNEAKKFFVFGEEELFKKDLIYEIYGEVTINLFQPSIYINKLRQLIKYIIIIKLIENHPNYFKRIGIPKKNRAIMIVTDGSYVEFIDKLSESKIFSEGFEKNNEFKTNTIDEIIKCKNFKEELASCESQINLLKTSNKDYNKTIKNLIENHDLEELKRYYLEYKNKARKDETKTSLKSRTKNILKILKSSKIPFLRCYFPKIGGEFPYDLFKDQPICLKKKKTETGYYEYKFTTINLNEEYVSKKDLNDQYVQKALLQKEYVSKKDIIEDYVKKEILVKEYVSKKDLNEKYVKKEILENEYVKRKELDELKQMYNELLRKYDEIKGKSNQDK